MAGSEGMNHGIELRGEAIEFARKRLQLFKQTKSYDKNFFAEPVFVEGNSVTAPNWTFSESRLLYKNTFPCI